MLCTFSRKLTHPARNRETELGNLFADVMQEDSSFDLMLLASGSLRKTELGPVVHVQDMKEFFPYGDSLHLLEVTGAQLRRMMAWLLREEAFAEGAHTEFYQVSKQLKLKWSRSRGEFLSFKFNGEELPDDRHILVALQDYHFNNFSEFFGVPFEEVAKNRRPRTVGSNCADIFEELFAGKRNLDARVEGRLHIVD